MRSLKGESAEVGWFALPIDLGIMTQVSLLAVFFGTLQCTEIFTGCDRDFDKYGGIVLWFLFMLYMFKALGVICDEYFVPSLEAIVLKLQVSNDVAGATFMAAGSSAPELFTSFVSTFLIVNAGGVGTIVGSAIFNVLVMNGVTAFVACKDQELHIWWYPLLRDCSWYLLSILELVIFLSDEEIEVWEGLIMVLTYLLYCLYMKFNPNIVRAFGIIAPGDTVDVPDDEGYKDEEANTTSADTGGSTGADSPEPPQGVGRPSQDLSVLPGPKPQAKWSYRETTERGFGSRFSSDTGGVSSQASQPEEGATEPPPAIAGTSDQPEAGSEDERIRRSCCRDPLVLLWEMTMPSHERQHGFPLFTLSIFWIGVCTYIMVDSTNRIGIILTIPPFVTGLIFLAAGTSIPDTLGSIAVAKQGEGDMAIANALGSNVFDILLGLGLPWMLKGMSGKEVKFTGQFDDFIWDIVILVAALFLFVACLCLNGWQLNRKIGGVLIAIYFIFVLYQMLAVFAFKWKDVDDRRLLPVGMR